mmetsp:Transcript_85652/g.242878  ORF Transcript_85652/g.242878 Transcript_85652/m.242878 type:complete len:225 (-) Transcript_85652:842-1516(-)
MATARPGTSADASVSSCERSFVRYGRAPTRSVRCTAHNPRSTKQASRCNAWRRQLGCSRPWSMTGSSAGGSGHGPWVSMGDWKRSQTEKAAICSSKKRHGFGTGGDCPCASLTRKSSSVESQTSQSWWPCVSGSGGLETACRPKAWRMRAASRKLRQSSARAPSSRKSLENTLGEKELHAMASVTAVKTETSSPRGVLRSCGLPVTSRRAPSVRSEMTAGPLAL